MGAARDGSRDDTDGMCKVRKVYLAYAAPEAPGKEEDFEGRSVWEDEVEDGRWLTDFPPPDGFEGWQEGKPGDDDYRRGLTEAEAKAQA